MANNRKASIADILRILRGLANSERVLKKALSAYVAANCLPDADDVDNEDDADEKDDFEYETDAEVVGLMIKDPELAPIMQSRILCVLHDIPFRMFHTFEAKAFDIDVTPLLPHFNPEEDEKKLIELLEQMIRLSSHLVYSAMKVSVGLYASFKRLDLLFR